MRRWAMSSTSSVTWRAGSARSLRSVTRRFRSRAAIRAARSTTVRAIITTRMSTLSSLLREKGLLALQDSPRDSDSRRVRRVHSSIAEAARAKRASLRVWGVGCVVDYPQVESDLRHVDAFTDRISIGLDDLVTRIEVWPGLHLDDRVAAVVVEIEIVAILQERSTNRDRPLVVERRTVHEVWLHVGRGEAVVEPVGVVRVLVVDHVRDHHVAHVRIERGGLTQDVHALHPRGLFGDLAKDVVCGLAERVVDVEDGGVRGA